MQSDPETHDPTDTHSFRAYADAGYQSLLVPIIPPNATLSANSAIPSHDKGKIPGRPVGPGEWAGFNWLDHQPTDRDIVKWDQAGAGLGLKTGSLVAIDIDVTDAHLSKAVRDVVVSRLGAAPWRVGKWPKALLVYRLADGEAAPRWHRYRLVGETIEHLIEVRGAGQQFVCEGQHPSGAQYEWHRPLPAFDDLPTVTSDDLAALWDELDDLADWTGWLLMANGEGAGGGVDRDAVDQDTLAADDLADMDAAVRHIPNDYDDREDYIRVGCAIKAAFADDPEWGRQVWQEWAAKWPGDADNPNGNEPATVDADWTRMKPPFEVGAHWLYELSRRGGYGAAHAASVFEPINEPKGESPDGDRGNGKQTGVAFWDEWTWVNDIKRFVHLPTMQLYDREQFNAHHAPDFDYLNGEKCPSARYLKTGGPRQVASTLSYRPGCPRFIRERGVLAVNRWQPGPAHDLTDGWAADAGAVGDADVAPWLQLVEALVPDDRNRRLLLDWLAYQIQQPGVKCNWHPLIWGGQGVGKDSFTIPLMHGLGANADTVGADTVTGKYTTWLEGRSLVVVQEINQIERKSIMDHVKPLLSCPPEQVKIEHKFVPEYSLPNIFNAILFSNHDNAVVLEQTDRRFFILEAPARQADTGLDAEFFTELYAWYYQQQGCAAVCAWLAGRELSADFNPQGHAPETAAKDDMKKLTQDVAEADLQEAIADESGIFGRDLVTLHEVREWVRREYGEQKARFVGPQRAAKMMQNAGAKEVGRYRIEGRRERVWAVRRLDTYEQLAGQANCWGRSGDSPNKPSGISREFQRQRDKLAHTGGVFDSLE